ncbi:hypothetical protein BvCmsKSP065_01570 [Escherichia coli]|nr:hypothetical protein BvCmsKSP065_01570 [Escherichia coli]
MSDWNIAAKSQEERNYDKIWKAGSSFANS